MTLQDVIILEIQLQLRNRPEDWYKLVLLRRLRVKLWKARQRG